jgi:hypothetical protein
MTSDEVVFKNLRAMVQLIKDSDDRHFDSHRLPRKLKHLRHARRSNRT